MSIYVAAHPPPFFLVHLGSTRPAHRKINKNTKSDSLACAWLMSSTPQPHPGRAANPPPSFLFTRTPSTPSSTRVPWPTSTSPLYRAARRRLSFAGGRPRSTPKPDRYLTFTPLRDIPLVIAVLGCKIP